jgi:hypothetical protein
VTTGVGVGVGVGSIDASTGMAGGVPSGWGVAMTDAGGASFGSGVADGSPASGVPPSPGGVDAGSPATTGSTGDGSAAAESPATTASATAASAGVEGAAAESTGGMS